MNKRFSTCFVIFMLVVGGILAAVWGMYFFSTSRDSRKAQAAYSYQKEQERASEQWLTSTTASLIAQESRDLLAELAEMPEMEHVSRKENLLVGLLSIKEREGRDNAMIHYVRASWLMPKSTGNPWGDLFQKDGAITQSLKLGRYVAHDDLTSLTAAWQPALAEIRKGVALNYAKNIGNTEGFSTPVPNYLAAQQATKILCVEGLLFESQGRFDEALDNYLTALTMGRDYGAEGGFLISHLISIAIETIVLERIQKIASAEGVELATLERALERMKEIETTLRPILEGFRLEEASTFAYLTILQNYPQMSFSGGKPETLWGLIIAGDFTWNRYKKASKKRALFRKIRANPEKAKSDHKALYAKRLEWMETLWWDPAKKRLEKELETMRESGHPLLKMAVPNYFACDVQQLVMRSRLRETRQIAALEAWKHGQGRYPESLEPLKGQFFAPALPIDPFSGKPFGYKTSPEGKSYDLWSIGPDSVDGGGAISYDPTNGTMSAGDVRY